MKESKAKKLRRIVHGKELGFLMECHNGLSAKVAEEAGFAGLWGSGLSISASQAVRDNNELSWTQVLELVEYISDATTVPLLVDGDTGYGNFNNMRRLVRKLEERAIAGVCIEDKLFPKNNSFLEGARQPLADPDEFCGKLKAGRDAARDDDFVIVARTEAFIAGWGLAEALKRAEAYRKAGADAILIHSKLRQPNEILAFMKEWARRSPVVIVPTKYYSTPTEVFEKAGVNVVIWANHLMRSSLAAMKQAAEQIHRERTLVNIEDRITPISEVFRLQGDEELLAAEKRYLPQERATTALILAASQGSELGALTADRPKALIPIAGRPLLERLVETFRSVGIKDVTVVRGYRKELFTQPDLRYVDNDAFAATHEARSLALGLKELEGDVLMTFGDLLCRKHIPLQLAEAEGDFCIAVDPDWKGSPSAGRYADLVSCSRPYAKASLDEGVLLKKAGPEVGKRADGEWIGMLKISAKGVASLQKLFAKLPGPELDAMRLSELLNRLVASGQAVRVLYVKGDWFDIDEAKDLLAVDRFRELR